MSSLEYKKLHLGLIKFKKLRVKLRQLKKYKKLKETFFTQKKNVLDIKKKLFNLNKLTAITLPSYKNQTKSSMKIKGKKKACQFTNLSPFWNLVTADNCIRSSKSRN